ncbi:MAG: UDP-N-acetylmuramoyl-L-alanine--D-glutamate ligase [Puniceicoccales bacterium]|jgi:UDP-N-acetylmuramoylalanine--D-glutamate ligase|nr:UDP-N-acetylmuramoyl-L-alanine--D-glutamate ligase [Puniceicoccales bacterium]
MDFPPSVIANRLARPVAVFGTGASGMAAAQLLAKWGVRVAFYDERIGAKDATEVFGEAEAAQHDLVVYSPGFVQGHPWLLTARRAGVLCLGELDFASLFWRDALVSVTGTNGKTTLTEFLVFAHKRAGREAVAAGNVGYPLSRVFELGGNRVPFPVCEVSSFQAESILHFTPSVLLWTNFAEDHLDRHRDLETYFRAKHKLVGRLGAGRLFVGESVEAHARRFGITLPETTGVVTHAEAEAVAPSEGVFSIFPQRENYAIARRYWIEAGLSERVLQDAARMFVPARHRLACVAEINGVAYWNDSKGTNFHAALAAMKIFAGPIHWIGGGRSKGGDLTAFASELARFVTTAWLIGETAPALHKLLQEKGIACRVFDTLPAAVFAVARVAQAGDTVLFSPGFASFDMFKSYSERGQLFEQTVFALKNRASASK